MSDELPKHVRPLMFAANELLFDLMRTVHAYLHIDMESLLILLCVNDASMRPLIEGPLSEVSRDEFPADSMRGSISRRMIADETGLPRETVRRKVEQLRQSALVQVDSDDRVRAAQMLGDPDLQQLLAKSHDFVRRFNERMAEVGP